MARQRRITKENENFGAREYKKLSNNRTANAKTKTPFHKKWNNRVAIFVAFNIIIVILSVVYFCYQYYLESIVTTPLKVPKITIQSGLDTPSMFWGSYRTGLYFGMQTRSPQTLATGIMWFTQKIVNNGLDIRHWCKQWNNVKYGWLQHDGENFGVQDIEEEDFVITTSFVKRLGGQHGGDWTGRIAFKPKLSNASVSAPISLMFYTTSTGEGILRPYIVNESQLVAIHGEMEPLGQFSIRFNSNPMGSTILKYNFLNTFAHNGLSHLKETVLRNLALFQSKDKGKLQVLGLIGHSINPDSAHQKNPANFIVHQVTFLPPFELEVQFESVSFHDRPEALVGPIYDAEMGKHKTHFERKFEDIFKLSSKGYNAEDIKVAHALLSNMLGGIGYFYGSSLVQSKFNKEPVYYWKAPLFTAVPSRSFFPRGFLWDEGFHNLLILRWNPELTKDILGHWLDLMNVEGWIPREQILGSEARERVPTEFIVQKNSNANPPTFFLTLESLVREMHSGTIPKDGEFLHRIFPRLKAWFHWFNTTQTGMLSGTYRWRGRDQHTNRELNPKTLTSGLDDYPRASHPTIDERHVDLRCWMAFSSGVLADIAEVIGEPVNDYLATYKYLTDNKLLDEYHWSSTSGSYSDFGFHTNSVKLVTQSLPPVVGGNSPPKTEKVRVASEEPILRYIDNCGYVSIFPFLLQIIKPENPKLGKLLTDLKDPKLMWTSYGLRSLARNSPFYMKYNTEHDPPYWRGAIWININFLAVRALFHYSQIPGPYQTQAYTLYKHLRENIVANVIKEYKRTGYIWEQYNDKTGQGQGAHPFTGWSSLVLLMMSELY